MKKIFETASCLSVEDIRSYLREEGSDGQRYQIENHLLDCPLCNDAVEGYANAYNFEEDTDLIELQKTFKPADQAAPPPALRARPARLHILRRAAAAAAIIGLLGAGWLYWNASAPERLYQAYHEPFFPENLEAVRSSSGQRLLPEPLLAASRLYEEGAYEKSIPLLEDFLATDSENTIATLLLGLAYLENNQLEAASDKLEIVRINSDLYYEEATWYAALAHLKADDQVAAKGLLNDLMKLEGGYYERKVKELLEKIESGKK